ncbi:hypothetical protein M514_10945 [Trichuris suis]|uniref:Peptidase S1 domain-containing protein n=1 Tax=Trichuris suis TaxID=68888 RepID=A0A085MXF0_9BILA|nr:hypothetical protein M514_10945 [Trichuris suis]
MLQRMLVNKAQWCFCCCCPLAEVYRLLKQTSNFQKLLDIRHIFQKSVNNIEEAVEDADSTSSEKSNESQSYLEENSYEHGKPEEDEEETDQAEEFAVKDQQQKATSLPIVPSFVISQHEGMLKDRYAGMNFGTSRHCPIDGELKQDDRCLLFPVKIGYGSGAIVPSTKGHFSIKAKNVSDNVKYANVECGNPGQFNVSMDSYFYAGVPMPWDVIIMHRRKPYRGAMQCLGVIVQLEKDQHHSNESRHVITSSNCLDYNDNYLTRKRKFKFHHMMVAAKLSGRKGAHRGLFKTKVVEAFLLDDIYSDMPTVILKLEKPITFGKNAQPVCLATEVVPIYPEYCYVTGYMTTRRRVREYHALLDRSFPCSGYDHEEVEGYGVCATKQKLKNVNHVGGPLVCAANGVAFLYGVFVNEFDAIGGSNKIMKKRAIFADILSSRLIRTRVQHQDNSTPPELENEGEEGEESSEFGIREMELGEFVSSESGQLFNLIAKLYPNSSVNATTAIGPSAGIVAHVITLRNHYKPTISGTATFLTDFPTESILVTNVQGINRRSGHVVYIYTGTKKGRSDIKPMVITVRTKTEHIFFRNYKRLGMSTLSLFYHINTTVSKRQPVSTVEGERPPKGSICYTAGLDASGRVHNFQVRLIDSTYCLKAFPGQFHTSYMYCVRQPRKPIVHTTGCPLICRAKNEWRLYASRAKLAPAQEKSQSKIPSQWDEDVVAYVLTQFKREDEFSEETEFEAEEYDDESIEQDSEDIYASVNPLQLLHGRKKQFARTGSHADSTQRSQRISDVSTYRIIAI